MDNTQAPLCIWISTPLFTAFFEDFHIFLLKKDINFVILHRITKLWKTIAPVSFSIRKN